MHDLVSDVQFMTDTLQWREGEREEQSGRPDCKATQNTSGDWAISTCIHYIAKNLLTIHVQTPNGNKTKILTYVHNYTCIYSPAGLVCPRVCVLAGVQRSCPSCLQWSLHSLPADSSARHGWRWPSDASASAPPGHKEENTMVFLLVCVQELLVSPVR